MANTLKFRGGSTSDIVSSTVSDREIIFDTDKNTLVLGSAKDYLMRYGGNNQSGNVGIGVASPSTALEVSGTVTATAFAGPLTGNVTGNVTGDVTGTVSGSSGSCTGNALTATTLQTARDIGGVSFNGSASITLPGVNTAGNQNTSGNAATATTLQTARNINGTSFDGSADIVVGNIPQNPQNHFLTDYPLVSSDAGKHVKITNGHVEVPSNVFSVGDAVSIYNDSASFKYIRQGIGVTLRQAGTSNTGARILAQRGICTVLCVNTNEFVICGTGVT